MHVHTYDCLISFNFWRPIVLVQQVFFGFNCTCMYEYMYNTYLIEVSGENQKIPISRTIYLEARKFSNSNYRHRAVLAMIYDMYILEYLRSKTLLSPPHAGITVRINVSASALLASLQLHMYLLAAPYLWPCTLRSPTLLSVE